MHGKSKTQKHTSILSIEHGVVASCGRIIITKPKNVVSCHLHLTVTFLLSCGQISYVDTFRFVTLLDPTIRSNSFSPIGCGEQ